MRITSAASGLIGELVGEFFSQFSQGRQHARVKIAVWRNQRIDFRKQQLGPDECCAEQRHDISQIFDCGFATAVAWRATEHTDATTHKAMLGEWSRCPIDDVF